MSYARDHGHAARKSQHNVSRIGNGLPGLPTQSHSVRASGYQPPISVTERATNRALVGRSAMHRSISRIAFLSGPSASLSRVLWEGGRADGPPLSLAFFPITHLFARPTPKSTNCCHLSLLLCGQTKLALPRLNYLHVRRPSTPKVYQSWKSSTCYGAREWGRALFSQQSRQHWKWKVAAHCFTFTWRRCIHSS